MCLRPPAGGVLDSAEGFGDGRLPTQGVDDRDEGPQVRQQVGAGAAGQDGKRLVPEGVEVRAGEFGQVGDQFFKSYSSGIGQRYLCTCRSRFIIICNYGYILYLSSRHQCYS